MCGQRIRIAKDGRSPRTFVNLARCRLVFRVFLVWYGFDLAFGFDFINTSVGWFLKWASGGWPSLPGRQQHWRGHRGRLAGDQLSLYQRVRFYVQALISGLSVSGMVVFQRVLN